MTQSSVVGKYGGKVGISLGMSMLPYASAVTLAGELDGAVSSIWVPDSQFLYRDCYVLLAGIALSTRLSRIGTMVSTISTRHPTVIAAAAGTVAELAPGRVELGLGTGDSAVRRIGEVPARLSDLETAIHQIRAFTGLEPSDFGSPEWTVPAVPLNVVATGDRTMEVAIGAADGLVLSVGSTPEIVSRRLTHARQKRPASGFPIRSFNFVSVAESKRSAIDTLKPAITWFGINHPDLVRETGVPFDDGIEEQLVKFRSDYGKYDLVHALTWDRAMSLAAFVPDEWVEAFGIAGTIGDCRRRLSELMDVGLSEVVLRAPCAQLWEETARAAATLNGEVGRV